MHQQVRPHQKIPIHRNNSLLSVHSEYTIVTYFMDYILSKSNVIRNFKLKCVIK